MKKMIKNSLLAVASSAALASPAMAAIVLEGGSLALGFYQVNSDNVIQPNTLLFDLGQASLYRENSQTGVSVSTINPGLTSSNIGAQLAAAFGPNWANSGDVRWVAFGGVGASEGTGITIINGDPLRTTYISRARNSFDDTATGASKDSIAPTIGSSTGTFGPLPAFGGSVTQIRIGSGSNAAVQTSGVNPDAVQIPTSALNTIDEQFPPFGSVNTYFTLGQGSNPLQTFQAGTFGGNSTAEGALDIYRYVNNNTTAGIDLTTALAPNSAVRGESQFIGTVVIDGLGNVSFGQVPEPSSALLLGILGMFGITRRNRSAK